MMIETLFGSQIVVLPAVQTAKQNSNRSYLVNKSLCLDCSLLYVLYESSFVWPTILISGLVVFVCCYK